MKEVNHDIERSDSRRADIRVPVIAVVGLVLSITGILFGQLQALSSSVERRFEDQRHTCNSRWTDFERRLDTKAEKSDAADRYTGSIAEERKESVDQRFKSIEDANAFAHESLRREIDHIHDMIKGK